MDRIVIEGGKQLHGDIAISGAKNAALPLIAATLLTPGWHTLHNVPDLRDTRTIVSLLNSMGVQSEWSDCGTLKMNSENLANYEVSYDLVKTMRASVLVLGPLLATLGRARVSLPGGCAIGARPIDYHLKGFQQMGCHVELCDGYVDARVDKSLQGTTIYFDIPSVTGTENIMMAAARAKGETIIKNAAKEPEVGNLVDMLIAMGCNIEGRDTDTLVIHGTDKLRPAEISIIPDRIETGTYLMAVGAAGGEVNITNCNPRHLPSLLEKLRVVGMEFEAGDDTIHVARSGPLHSADITTMPYPGFPTDLQAQFMALMCLSPGTSLVHETIFENRFMHVAELGRLGADIRTDGHSAFVTGVEGLRGASVMATDLRASASLVVAGLAAQGETRISRIYHLERGYSGLVDKLAGVGAVIRKEKEPS